MMRLEEQVEWIKSGGLCVYPTSTQPAVGCLPEKKALDLLFKVKNRSDKKPVSLGVLDLLQASDFVKIPDHLEEFLSFFPRGALTVLLQPSIECDARLGTAGLAIRILDHEIARELVTITGPLSATSANKSGTIPSNSCSVAALELGGRDSGVHWIESVCTGGSPSTLISYPSEITPNAPRRPEILRKGIVPENEVIEAWMKLI